MTSSFSAIGRSGVATGALSGDAPSAGRHILLMPLGTWGDVLPYIRLGRELRQRGHSVCLATCELFEPQASQAGLDFLPVLNRDEYEQIWATPLLWHPRLASIMFLREAVLPFMRRQYELARGLIRAGRCDVLVAPAQSLGARIAQAKHAVPLATVHLAPYMFRSALASRQVSGAGLPEWFPPAWKRAMYRLADFCGDQSLGRTVNALNAELELPRAKRVFWEWWNSPERIVGLFPEWFAAPQTDWPEQSLLAGFLPDALEERPPLDERVEEYLDAGEPPILFTAGTAMAHGERFFAESVLAADRLGTRAILLCRYPEQLPHTLPPSVLAVDFVPLERLLRRVAAVVHHGGIGTTAQALAAGVPQLPVPMSFDQPDNAHRVVSLGVGRSLRRRDYSAKVAAPLLESLTTDGDLRARCLEMAERCRTTDALQIAGDAIDAMLPAVAGNVERKPR